MKRFTFKSALVIFIALILFALYLLTCFPLLNAAVFSWKENSGGIKNKSQISGNENSNENNSDDGSNSTIGNGDTGDNAGNIDSNHDTLTFDFENPLNPEISDYIIVSITAKNTGLSKYPYGSIAVNLSEENPYASGSSEIYRIQERARIFVDGIKHNYYVAVGENKYWRYDWNLDGPTPKGLIRSLEIEIPSIEGVDIQISSVSVNKRLIFAADSHINYFFKNYFQLSFIDRFLTPAYIFLILFAAVFIPFGFLLKRTRDRDKDAGIDYLQSEDVKSHDSNGKNSIIVHVHVNNMCTANKVSDTKSTLRSNELTDSKISFKTFVLFVPLLLLVFFSFYFINNFIFTVKGYWDSYKQNIISGRLDETYYGFSDFEKFVTWVGEKVPQGQNVIVLVKGEPVYIMAQMAYGLYPKDIWFIDISSLSADEIPDRITSFNSVYEYIVVLSETDKEFLKSLKVELDYSYRENAGFIYKLILK